MQKTTRARAEGERNPSSADRKGGGGKKKEEWWRLFGRN
jgi:hypothetical protein